METVGLAVSRKGANKISADFLTDEGPEMFLSNLRTLASLTAIRRYKMHGQKYHEFMSQLGGK
jgi:hypothetical protein